MSNDSPVFKEFNCMVVQLLLKLCTFCLYYYPLLKYCDKLSADLQLINYICDVTTSSELDLASCVSDWFAGSNFCWDGLGTT
eukprot:2661024-Pleurochrysis_carterae.AAC.3